MSAYTRDAIMASPSVRNLTKDILTLAKGRDPVKVVQDAKLALNVLENEMHQALARTEQRVQRVKQYEAGLITEEELWMQDHLDQIEKER